MMAGRENHSVIASVLAVGNHAVVPLRILGDNQILKSAAVIAAAPSFIIERQQERQHEGNENNFCDISFVAA